MSNNEESTREELLEKIKSLETALQEAQAFGGKTEEEYYEDEYAADYEDHAHGDDREREPPGDSVRYNDGGEPIGYC